MSSQQEALKQELPAKKKALQEAQRTIHRRLV